jgi:hypothetical protein
MPFPYVKDLCLNPIKEKNNLPKYQVTMYSYFNIPNQMAFTNITQDGGRLIKGSAIMGFSHDPKQCLDEVPGKLRTMGCLLLTRSAMRFS